MKTMRISLYLLIFSVLCVSLVGCSHMYGHHGSGQADINRLWNMDGYPLNVFMGISAPYSTKEQEIAEALYQCARNIAISERLHVTSALVSESSSADGLISFATDGTAQYAEDDILEIMDRLILLAVRDAGDEGVVIVAEDPTRHPTERPYRQQFDEDHRPTWTVRLPEIPGYLVAMGETLGHRYTRDSVEAADVLAAEALIEKSSQAVTAAKSYAINFASDDEGFFQEGVLQETSGSLDGFVVLARWYDKRKNRYYSLAAVPKPFQGL